MCILVRGKVAKVALNTPVTEFSTADCKPPPLGGC
jgi:hypothetical protein